MKKRWLPYVIFGLVFYLLFLVIEMPASWFAWGLNRYSGGTVRLDPISGSLWHGNGKLVIYYPQTVPHDLVNSEWSVNPLWLLTGRVQMHLQTNSPDQQIDATLRFGGNQMQLLDTKITLSASALSSFYSPASLIAPQGQVSLQTGKFIISSKGLEGNAEIQWQNAASSLSTVQPLGNYRLEMNGVGKTTNLKLSTLNGALELTGQGQWEAQTGQIQFAGSAVPRERAAEMESLLTIFGNDQGNGRRALNLNSRLPLVNRLPAAPITPG